MLNAQQKKAVQTTKGHVLVLAGAGSGKTRVIIERIAYLIKNDNIDPCKILGLTFTNKAAIEMRQRLAALISPKIAKKVTLCTFHSFCMKILREHIHHLGFTKNFSLYDEKDRNRVITQVVKDFLQEDKALPSIASLVETISQAKNKGHEEFEDTFIKAIYQDLQTAMRAYNALDFDSLIPTALKLLKTNMQVQKSLQESYQYLMIDEYQDTNPVQFELAKILSQKHRNLFVVGDDDQSIYGWRGAEIKNILEFKADTTIKLEQNYRCHPHILKAANAVIKNNKNRHSKTLWCSKEDTEKISIFHAPSEEEEATAIVDRIIHFHNQGIAFKDIAILYRSNALSRNIEMALLNGVYKKDDKWVRGIPYQVFGGLEFNQRSEIKDLFAYLRFIINPMDTEALVRIINVPRRGISNVTLEHLTSYHRKHHIPIWDLLKTHDLTSLGITSRAIKGIDEFVTIIDEAKNRFASNSLQETFIWLIKRIDYELAIKQEVKSEKMRGFKWENVQECINAISQYEQEEKKPSLSHFITTSMLNNETPYHNKKQLKQNSLNLMTLHSSKGLEFEVCFLIGLEDHILPHEKSMGTSGLEEERRLFYVGITRAKKHLICSMSRSRRKMGKKQATTPSRFLFEIPKELFKVCSLKTPD